MQESWKRGRFGARLERRGPRRRGGKRGGKTRTNRINRTSKTSASSSDSMGKCPYFEILLIGEQLESRLNVPEIGRHGDRRVRVANSEA